MRWLVVTMLAFLATPLSALAQPLTLEQAFVIAEANNPGLKAEQARGRIADAEVTTAGAWPNPTLLSDNGVAEDSYRLGIQQTLMLGGKLRGRVAVADARRTVVGAEIFTNAIQLRASVRRAYAQLYSARQRVTVWQQLTEQVKHHIQEADKFEDHIQLEFALNTIQNEMRLSKNDAAISQHQLNSLLNQPLTDQNPVELPPALVVNLSLQSLIDQAAVGAPEMRVNAGQQEVWRRELSLARRNRIPNFTFAVGPDLVTPPEVAQFSVFAIGYLDLPIFNRQQGPIREALHRQLQLDRSREAIRNRVSLAVANGLQNYVFTAEQMRLHQQELIPRAGQLQREAKEAFQRGQLTVDTLLESDANRAHTELAYLKSLADNQSAIADMELALGKGL